MKLVYLLMCVTLLGGCASAKQKQRFEYLQDVHKAERLINQGKVNMAIGSAIVNKGTAEVSKGTKAYEEAKSKLEKSL